METNLGQLVEGDAGRDAIHVACAPMKANDELSPGQHVGIVRGGIAGDWEPFVGIVDPFLKEKVKTGERFWLVLYPKTVTGIRHHWSHPAFNDAPDYTLPSREWITAFAAKWGLTFENIMAGATQYFDSGSEMDDNWKQLDIEDAEWEMFWIHFKTITGKSFKGPDKQFIICCPN